MKFRARARRILARLRLEADRAATAAFEVAEAMLRPQPTAGVEPTAAFHDEHPAASRGRHVKRPDVVVHTWNAPVDDEIVRRVTEQTRRDHVARRHPGMY